MLEAAPRYARAVTGAPATPTNAAEVVAGLPDGLDHADKHVWLLQAQGRRIGAVDLLDGYPHAGVAWVGLLVLDEAHQGRGLGRRGWAAVERRVRSWGHVDEVRLAVVRTNEAVLPFWRRCGFTETGETHPYRHGPVASESVVLRKSLRG